MTWETYIYGKFITRIKGDDKLGTCSSFFTFWKGTPEETWWYGGWSEIDIELVPSDSNGTLYTNLIWENQRMDGEAINRGVANPEDDWNTYEF